MDDPQNIHPGTTSTGGDPSKFVAGRISPTKDADGFSLGELGSHIRALKGIHMDAMRDALANPDAEHSSVDYGAIREHAIRILQMVGAGEPAAAGDSRSRALAHDAHRRASGGVSAAGIFPALQKFGTPQGDHVARAGAPSRIVGGVPIWAGLSRFAR